MSNRETWTGRIALVVLMAVTAMAAVLVLAGGASAQEEDPYADDEPSVQPTLIIQDDTENLPDDDNGTLPLTGADLTLFAATGFAAIGTGALIVRRNRKPEDDA